MKRCSGSTRLASEQDPIVQEALQQVLDERRLLEELIAAHKEEMARVRRPPPHPCPAHSGSKRLSWRRRAARS